MSDLPATIVTQPAGGLDIPVPSGFKSDNNLHRRNLRSIQDFLSNPLINNATIKDLVVGSANISDLSVDKLTGGTLQADVLLAATIRTALTADRVEIDSAGLRAYDSSGNQTVNIASTGSASFEGALTALSLLVNGAATFTGATKFDAGAAVSFGSGGTADPIVGPSLSWDLDSFATTITGRNARAFDWNGTNYRFTDPTARQIVTMSNVGALVSVKTYASAHPYGVATHSGTEWAEFVNGTTLSIGNVSAGTTIYSTIVGSGPTACGLTHNGTNLVALLNRTGTTVNYRVMSGTGTAVSNGTLTLTQDNVTDICWDGTYYYVVTTEGTAHYARAFNSSFVRASAQDFQVGTGDSRGLTIVSGSFQSISNDVAKVEEYSGWVSASTMIHARYEWFNNGSSARTLGSPDTTTGFMQQWRLSYTTPDFPTGADRAKMFMFMDSSSTPPSQTSSSNKLQATNTTRQAFFTSYNGSGTAIDASNTFTGGTAATLVLPLAGAAPSAPVEGQIYHNTSTHKSQVYDGTTWNNLW